MNKNSYEAIQAFCDSRKDTITISERDFMVRKFLEVCFDTIQKQTQNNGVSPTDKEIEIIEQSLLGDNNLESYADSARKFYMATQQSLINDYDKRFKRDSFWRGLWVNILGAFAYSAILFIVYLVAKDQIYQWIQGLINVTLK